MVIYKNVHIPLSTKVIYHRKGKRNWHFENLAFIKRYSPCPICYGFLNLATHNSTEDNSANAFSEHIVVCAKAKHRCAEKQHANAWLDFQWWEKDGNNLKAPGILMLTLLLCSFTCKIMRWISVSSVWPTTWDTHNIRILISHDSSLPFEQTEKVVEEWCHLPPGPVTEGKRKHLLWY